MTPKINEEMKYLAIENQLFIKNRAQFLSKLDEDYMAVFNSNDIMPTNADGIMPFKQNNDLFWLTGVDQEESILIIYPDNPNKQEQEILFLKETSELIAIWEGAKLSKSEALTTYGIIGIKVWIYKGEIFTKEFSQETNKK